MLIVKGGISREIDGRNLAEYIAKGYTVDEDKPKAPKKPKADKALEAGEAPKEPPAEPDDVIVEDPIPEEPEASEKPKGGKKDGATD